MHQANLASLNKALEKWPFVENIGEVCYPIVQFKKQLLMIFSDLIEPARGFTSVQCICKQL